MLLTIVVVVLVTMWQAEQTVQAVQQPFRPGLPDSAWLAISVIATGAFGVLATGINQWVIYRRLKMEAKETTVQVAGELKGAQDVTLKKLDAIHDLVDGKQLTSLRQAVIAHEDNVASRKLILGMKRSKENMASLDAAVRLLEEAKCLYEEQAKHITDSIVRAQKLKEEQEVK